ncbi:4Fe-4S dicluster domain-containing protein [Candidatus Bathyarchaeota archaeon]|nr:4Fe-4S dicluster domain-containing protein [Candidatus Bathyarchaeota archaeon]
MITYYGYQDGSGEYYIVIDAEKCDSCQECTKVCPESALQMEDMFIDLEDKRVAAITEEHRKKIRYTCSPCKPEKGNIPCILACNQNAITCIWKPK